MIRGEPLGKNWKLSKAVLYTHDLTIDLFFANLAI